MIKLSRAQQRNLERARKERIEAKVAEWRSAQAANAKKKAPRGRDAYWAKLLIMWENENK